MRINYVKPAMVAILPGLKLRCSGFEWIGDTQVHYKARRSIKR